MFDLRPETNGSNTGGRGQDKGELFPPSLFEGENKVDMRIELFVCTGEVDSGKLPKKCGLGAKIWRYMTAEAEVRVMPKKRTVGKKRKKRKKRRRGARRK